MNDRSASVPLLGGVALAYALILAAAAVPAWQPVLWGVHAWTFLPPAALLAVLGAAAALVALVLSAPPYPGSIVKALPAALVTAPFFFLFRDATHLLGDGRLWISVLADQRAHHAHEPVAFAAALAVTAGKFITATYVERRMEIASVVLGVIAVFLMIRIAARLADDGGADTPSVRRGRWLTLGLLLGMGTLQFGFGYIEAYPLFWVAVLLHVHFVLEVLKGRLPFAWTGVSLGFAVAVHGSGVLLGPSFLVMLFFVRPKLSSFLLACAAGALPVIGAYVGLPAVLPEAAGAPAGFKVSAWNRIFSEFHFYAWGAGAWALGQVNRWSLVSGAAVGLVVAGCVTRFGGRRGGGTDHDGADAGSRAVIPVLAAAAAGLALPAVLLDMEGSRGAAADWDAFSPAAVPLMCVAALLWLPAVARSRGARVLLAVTAGLGCVATLAFVGVNASEPLALKRFAALADHVFVTPRAKSWAYESLAIYYRDDQKPDEAATFYGKAVQFQTTNPRLIRNAASLLIQTQRYAEAGDMYRRLTAVEGNDPKVWFSLGAMLEQSGKPDSAMIAYRESLKRDPNAWEPMNYLARLVLRTPAGITEGRALIERSLAIKPDQPTAEWGREMLKGLDEYEAKNRR